LLAAGEILDRFLLVGTLESKPGEVLADRDGLLAKRNLIGPAADLFDNRMVPVEPGTILVDIGKPDRLAGLESPFVR